MTRKEWQMTGQAGRVDGAVIAALRAANAEVRMQLALQTEIASKSTERITGMAKELGGLEGELRVLIVIVSEKMTKIKELEISLDEKDISFRNFQGELRTVSEAFKRDPQLKTCLNRCFAGCGRGLGLAGAGCCPNPSETEGRLEHAKKAANGALCSLVMGDWIRLLCYALAISCYVCAFFHDSLLRYFFEGRTIYK
jgi:hypothetical protein